MKLTHLLCAGVVCSGFGLSNGRLLTVPITPFTKSGGEYSLSQLKSIVVDSSWWDAVDNNGQTLIPPTLQEFAQTFQEDLKSSIGIALPLSQATEPPNDSIFLTVKNSSGFHDVAGRYTSEGYSLTINSKGIIIAGASPLGTWWGTRSLIQTAVVGGLSLPQGSGVDAPGWGTRGAFVCKLLNLCQTVG